MYKDTDSIRVICSSYIGLECYDGNCPLIEDCKIYCFECGFYKGCEACVTPEILKMEIEECQKLSLNG